MPRTSRRLIASAVVASTLLVSGCGGGADVDGSVTVLARADGWRDGPGGVGDVHRLLEVAADEATARQAWDDNVPDDLPEVDGHADAPTEAGIYGSFDEVDLETHRLVVWSSGQSGTCPEWVADIDTDGDAVEATVSTDVGPDQGCTDDFNPYRLVLAVEHSSLPDPADLPMPLTGDGTGAIPDGAVAYPAP